MHTCTRACEGKYVCTQVIVWVCAQIRVYTFAPISVCTHVTILCEDTHEATRGHMRHICGVCEGAHVCTCVLHNCISECAGMHTQVCMCTCMRNCMPTDMHMCECAHVCPVWEEGLGGEELADAPTVPTPPGDQLLRTPLHYDPFGPISHPGASCWFWGRTWGDREKSALTDDQKPCCLTPQQGFTLASSGPNRQLPGEEGEGVVGPVGNRNGHACPVESHGTGATAPSTEVAPNQPHKTTQALSGSRTFS